MGMSTQKKKKGGKNCFFPPNLSSFERCRPLFLLPLYLQFGAAAFIVSEQIQRALIQIFFAGFKDGYHILFLLTFFINVFQALAQRGVFLFGVGQPDFHQLLVIPDVYFQITSHSFIGTIFLIFPAVYTLFPVGCLENLRRQRFYRAARPLRVVKLPDDFRLLPHVLPYMTVDRSASKTVIGISPFVFF